MGGLRQILRASVITALAASLLGMWADSGSAFAAAPSYSEDEIEAAFLYRFAGFVSWPQGALDRSLFTISVLDDDAVAGDLARMLLHQELQGRHAQVRRITSIDQLGDAQILFIGESGAKELKRWLAPLAGRPVLIVTSQPGGLQDGGTINFLVLDSHVRFEVSLAAAQRSGLTISADLLSVATHVIGRPVGSDTPCQLSAPQWRALSYCAPRLATR